MSYVLFISKSSIKPLFLTAYLFRKAPSKTAEGFLHTEVCLISKVH